MSEVCALAALWGASRRRNTGAGNRSPRSRLASVRARPTRSLSLARGGNPPPYGSPLQPVVHVTFQIRYTSTPEPPLIRRFSERPNESEVCQSNLWFACQRGRTRVRSALWPLFGERPGAGTPEPGIAPRDPVLRACERGPLARYRSLVGEPPPYGSPSHDVVHVTFQIPCSATSKPVPDRASALYVEIPTAATVQLAEHLPATAKERQQLTFKLFPCTGVALFVRRLHLSVYAIAYVLFTRAEINTGSCQLG